MTALRTNEVEATEVISFAKWILLAILAIYREEFGGDYNTAVLFNIIGGGGDAGDGGSPKEAQMERVKHQ